MKRNLEVCKVCPIYMPNATKSTCVLEAMKHIKLSSAGYFISDKYIDDTNMHKDCHYKMEHMIFNGNTPK